MLFQVLAFLGEWDKAERHLETIAAQRTGAETGVQVYRNLVTADRQRGEVVSLRLRPSFLPKTPFYAERYFAACAALAEGRHDEALGLFEEVENERPDISGTRDGKPFEGFSDIDALLRCFLEAVVLERYVWIPFESIETISIAAPKTLFDLLWVPARVTTWDGLALSCYLPVLYPDSPLHADDRVKLGRMTEWRDAGGGFVRGVGQHIYQAGSEEVPLLEMRDIVFTKNEPAAGEGTGDEKRD
jgi:type VI secretion system protein ImpE